MASRLAVVALAFISILTAVSAATAQEVVRYDMQVRLDPADHTLEGSQHVRWKNSTDTPTSELWWHLYLNAFASNDSTFMREWRRSGPGRGAQRPGGWGWVRFQRLTLADGTDLMPALEFVRPDDGNPDDFTVVRVRLPEEVPPGGVVEVETSFAAQLPAIVERTGYAGDFNMVAQFFPKLGVFDGSEGWICHQFHAAGEFFADFGSFRVAMTVPEGWIVGATGVEVERGVEDGGEQRVVFSAERVHDFAWAAAPAAMMAVVEADFDPGRDVPQAWLDRAERLLARGPADLELPSVHLRLLLPRGQLGLADRMLAATRLAMAWFGLHYGPYPYPQLTVLSPPPTAERAGGMEYPTLITTGASRLLELPLLSWLPWIETVTVHEFGHQIFYGLLASNEGEEAWLDEGLTTFAETECMTAIVADRLGGRVSLPVSSWGVTRLRLQTAPLPLRVDEPAWDFRNLNAYAIASYDKAALAMKTLQGLLGEETFARALAAYAERYRYRHPTGRDLQAVFEEVSGQSLGWFFDQAVRGDARADWAVLRVRDRRPQPPEGLEWTGDEWRTAGDGEGGEGGWVGVVELGRNGDLVAPVQVALRYADGSETRRTWDSAERWVRWRIPAEERLTAVVVDPDGVWAMETERADNYWRSRSDATAARRSLWWLADALQLLGLAHLPWS